MIRFLIYTRRVINFINFPLEKNSLNVNRIKLRRGWY